MYITIIFVVYLVASLNLMVLNSFPKHVCHNLKNAFNEYY